MRMRMGSLGMRPGDLGMRMRVGGLGKRLGDLGMRLGELGTSIGGLRIRLADLGMRMGGLEMRLGELGTRIDGLGMRLGWTYLKLFGKQSCHTLSCPSAHFTHTLPSSWSPACTMTTALGVSKDATLEERVTTWSIVSPSLSGRDM